MSWYFIVFILYLYIHSADPKVYITLKRGAFLATLRYPKRLHSPFHTLNFLPFAFHSSKWCQPSAQAWTHQRTHSIRPASGTSAHPSSSPAPSSPLSVSALSLSLASHVHQHSRSNCSRLLELLWEYEGCETVCVCGSVLSGWDDKAVIKEVLLLLLLLAIKCLKWSEGLFITLKLVSN